MTSPSLFRLPTNIRPRRYELSLEPDLDSFTFSGEETVLIDVAESSSTIVLNAAELAVSEASVDIGSEVLPGTIAHDDETERLTLEFPKPLPLGEARLHLRFTGTLNDQLRGFYRSRYAAADGTEQYLATTQFEATDARRAFPCWDEPAVKAEFVVTLVVSHQHVAISNMPMATEHPTSDAKRAVTFQPTPPMSTYLLAFVVGDLASVMARTKSGTRIGVWATRGKEEQGRFALENSVRILDYMNDYFGIDYPLPKMDHIAIPDFAAGAMENWGAITYRETALLFDPENSAAQVRQRVLEVVAHEMAHMWFGDLVTMEWWEDLWLNESFASWMGDKAVDHLYPEWQMWTQFVSQDTNTALGLDGLRNSHPIEMKVNDPAEIRELFDPISYSKGGSVLRMLEDYLGAETFREGLHRYLSTHSYGNARTEHLWSALAEASSKPVIAVMDSWVKQTGYPVLDVETRRGPDGLAVQLKQSRFLYDHLLDGSPDATVWQVPVTVSPAGADPASLLMTETNASTALPASGEGWLKVNAGQTGFFRVRYPDDEWERLAAGIASKDLPATDRLSLQNDAYALMRAGYLPATVFLSLARSYVNEDAAPVWSDLAANLRGLEALLADQPYVDRFRGFARGLFADAAAEVGWDARAGEEHLDALKRSTVLGQFGGYGDEATLAEAKRRFDAHLDGAGALHPDLRGVVFGLVAQQGDRGAYDTLWDLERRAEMSEEKMRLLGALTRFQDRDLLTDLLTKALNPEEVRIQDAVLVIAQTAGNLEGRDLVWDFIRENWAELDRRYGKGGFAITRMVGITGGFTKPEREAEVAAFFEANPAPSAARTIQQSLERIRLNAAWLERNAGPVGEWLAANG